MLGAHTTVQLKIAGRVANIDAGIVDVIEWMNSLDGVQTTHCCEGEWERGYKAYISFTCSEKASLVTILTMITTPSRRNRCTYGEVKTDIYRGAIRHRIQFHSAKKFKDFRAWVRRLRS